MVTVTKVAEGHRNVSLHCPLCEAHIPRNAPAWKEHMETVHSVPRVEFDWSLHVAANVGRKDYDEAAIYDFDHICYNCNNSYATKADLIAHIIPNNGAIVNEDVTYILQEDGFLLLME